MSGLWLFDLIDSRGLKLYTFKLRQYKRNSTATTPNSPYELPTNQFIYDPGSFIMEITYSYTSTIPIITDLGVYYTPDGSLTDPNAGKFYLRFTTNDKSIYLSQNNKFTTYTPTNGSGSQSGNYAAMTNLAASDIVYTFGPAQSPSGSLFINSLPLNYNIGGSGTQTLDNTVWTSSILVPVQIPAEMGAMATQMTNRKATAYYINRLLKMGYSMSQIVPTSLYTSYTTVYLTFPSYDLHQLFMDGNLALNGCHCDKGRIY